MLLVIYIKDKKTKADILLLSFRAKTSWLVKDLLQTANGLNNKNSLMVNHRRHQLGYRVTPCHA